MAPLRRDWEAISDRRIELAAKESQKASESTQRDRLRAEVAPFLDRLCHAFAVLDPACGSGNFLYVASLLLWTWRRRSSPSRAQGIRSPTCHPQQLDGIEINRYAQELAQSSSGSATCNGCATTASTPPARTRCWKPIESIRRMDAILDLTNPAAPLEPEWPEAEFIVGNPPFLGGKVHADATLGDDYVDRLFEHCDASA